MPGGHRPDRWLKVSKPRQRVNDSTVEAGADLIDHPFGVDSAPLIEATSA